MWNYKLGLTGKNRNIILEIRRNAKMGKKINFIASLIVVLFLTAFYIPTTDSADGTYVSYFLPFLHTSTSSPVYCVATNNGIGADNVTQMRVHVMSTASSTFERGGASVPIANTNEFSFKKTTMITFKEQGIYMGSNGDPSIDISPYVGTSEAYGAKLTFISTIKMGSNALRDSHLNCKTLPMACFIGTTNPKRNLVGIICEAGYVGSTDLLYSSRPYNIEIENFAPVEYWADNTTGVSF
jgi:hypothetical protein